jgi:hypothetical protein
MSLRRLVAVAVGILIPLAMTACGTGKRACDGFSPSDGYRWCVDSMTDSECTDFTNRRVNGATWQLWEGQTCAERGCASHGPC